MSKRLTAKTELTADTVVSLSLGTLIKVILAIIGIHVAWDSSLLIDSLP